VQPAQPYAVEVAPGTYVINRPAAHATQREDRAERASGRAATRNDPRLIEELRQRHARKSEAARRGEDAPVKKDVINTRRIVRHKPVVIETTRVVDDPPKVIVRKRYVDDTPTASIPRHKQTAAVEKREPLKPEALRSGDGKKRVIEADAEVTILGPDRMSIRLFRKRRGAEAKASVE
jgi:hypothetical protein